MDLDTQLQNILRVPQPKDINGMIVLDCESEYNNVSSLQSSETYSHPVLVQHRTELVYTNQKPFKPHSNKIPKEVSRRKKWDINTLLGHVLLLVYHLVQWEKICQTRGVSAQTLDE